MTLTVCPPSGPSTGPNDPASRASTAQSACCRAVKPPASERRKNWILASASVVVALLALEFAVRIARGKLTDTSLLSAEYHSSGSERPRAQYDPLLGWVPNLGQREERGATYTILPGNLRSNGRAVEPSGPPVLVVGDSFAFGEEVDDAETWPAQLEGRIGRRVINGAVFNYGLDQIVLRSELLVERHEPEVLIVGFIPDDILRCAQAVRLQPKPYFLLEARARSATAGSEAEPVLALRNVPVPLLERDQKYPPMDTFRRYLGYSHAIDFVMRRLNPNYWLDPRIALVRSAGTEDVEGSDPVAIASALMERLARLRVRRPRLRILVIAQHERHLWEDQVPMTERVLAAAAGAGLAVLDTYAPLARLRQLDEARFRSFFTNHMTAAGNEWVADQIEPLLKALLAPAAHPETAPR